MMELNTVSIISLVVLGIGGCLTFFALWVLGRFPALTGDKFRKQLIELRAEIDQIKSDRVREVDTLRTEINRLRAMIDALTEKVAQDAEIKARQIEHVQKLERTLAAYTGRVNGGPLNGGPHAEPQPVKRLLQTDLRRTLQERFEVSEMRALVADLTGDPETVLGDTKTDLAQNIVTYCVNRQNIPALMLAIRQARPDIELRNYDNS